MKTFNDLPTSLTGFMPQEVGGASAGRSNLQSDFSNVMQSEAVSLRRSSLPRIAPAGQLTPEQTQASAVLVGAAQNLLACVGNGQSASSLVAPSTDLRHALQSSTLTPNDASALRTTLDGIKNTLMSSPRYDQSMTPPVAQSELEGNILIAADRLDAAIRSSKLG